MYNQASFGGAGAQFGGGLQSGYQAAGAQSMFRPTGSVPSFYGQGQAQMSGFQPFQGIPATPAYQAYHMPNYRGDSPGHDQYLRGDSTLPAQRGGSAYAGRTGWHDGVDPSVTEPDNGMPRGGMGMTGMPMYGMRMGGMGMGGIGMGGIGMGGMAMDGMRTMGMGGAGMGMGGAGMGMGGAGMGMGGAGMGLTATATRNAAMDGTQSVLRGTGMMNMDMGGTPGFGPSGSMPTGMAMDGMRSMGMGGVGMGMTGMPMDGMTRSMGMGGVAGYGMGAGAASGFGGIGGYGMNQGIPATPAYQAYHMPNYRGDSPGHDQFLRGDSTLPAQRGGSAYAGRTTWHDGVDPSASEPANGFGMSGAGMGMSGMAMDGMTRSMGMGGAGMGMSGMSGAGMGMSGMSGAGMGGGMGLTATATRNAAMDGTRSVLRGTGMMNMDMGGTPGIGPSGSMPTGMAMDGMGRMGMAGAGMGMTGMGMGGARSF